MITIPLNRSIKILMLGIIVITFQTNVFGQNKKVFNCSIEIWTDKDTFFEVEEIPLYIRITNNEEKGPYISRYIQQRLEIKNSKGERYKPQTQINIVGVEPMEKGVKEYAIPLLDVYSIIDKNHPGISRYLPPERYTVQCVWGESGYAAIYSNIMEFFIIPPNTREEEAALNIYREAMKYRYHRELDLAEEKYDELLNLYPNSVYRSFALDGKLFIKHKKIYNLSK